MIVWKYKKRGNSMNLLLYHDLILSIVAALEAKDTYTADHSLRVSDMVEQLCKIMGLSEEETDKIHMAAHVHDIGKIGVPDNILSKSDCLNPKEWAIMMEHPRIGANILSKSKGLSEIADIVLHHHERWNGKGYPDRLSENAIPFGSRIIAVCDSIDAMMSQRNYRNYTFSAEQCRNELQKNIGIMYDPLITNTTITHWVEIVAKEKY